MEELAFFFPLPSPPFSFQRSARPVSCSLSLFCLRSKVFSEDQSCSPTGTLRVCTAKTKLGEEEWEERVFCRALFFSFRQNQVSMFLIFERLTQGETTANMCGGFSCVGFPRASSFFFFVFFVAPPSLELSVLSSTTTPPVPHPSSSASGSDIGPGERGLTSILAETEGNS